MRLAISNIAWKPEERDSVFDVLSSVGAGGLEIAPALAFPREADPFEPSAAAVEELRLVLGTHGLRLVSMQSLLFGVRGAALFGTVEERARFHDGIARAVRLAGRLGIPNLVMGAPTNRVVPEGMARADAERLACDAFGTLGDLCQRHGTVLALEPNPKAYGTNFLNTVAEAATLAKRVDHAAVTVNFDLGALHMNGEISDAAPLFAEARAKVSHVHVSEPHLAPAPQDPALFATVARAILSQGYAGWFSIEMRSGSDDNVAAVRRALTSCADALRQAELSVEGSGSQ